MSTKTSTEILEAVIAELKNSGSLEEEQEKKLREFVATNSAARFRVMLKSLDRKEETEVNRKMPELLKAALDILNPPPQTDSTHTVEPPVQENSTSAVGLPPLESIKKKSAIAPWVIAYVVGLIVLPFVVSSLTYYYATKSKKVEPVKSSLSAQDSVPKKKHDEIVAQAEKIQSELRSISAELKKVGEEMKTKEADLLAAQKEVADLKKQLSEKSKEVKPQEADNGELQRLQKLIEINNRKIEKIKDANESLSIIVKAIIKQEVWEKLTEEAHQLILAQIKKHNEADDALGKLHKEAEKFAKASADKPTTVLKPNPTDQPPTLGPANKTIPK